MIESKHLYRVIEAAFADAREQLDAHAPGEINIMVFQFEHRRGDIRFEISRGYGPDEIRVKGRALQELVDEFIRRVEFNHRQSLLALGAPTIDGEQQ